MFNYMALPYKWFWPLYCMAVTDMFTVTTVWWRTICCHDYLKIADFSTYAKKSFILTHLTVSRVRFTFDCGTTLPWTYTVAVLWSRAILSEVLLYMRRMRWIVLQNLGIKSHYTAQRSTHAGWPRVLACLALSKFQGLTNKCKSPCSLFHISNMKLFNANPPN